MTIGEVASRAGLAASAIRYYERLGLLPEAPRRSGRRYYESGVLSRLAVVAFARRTGFTLAETRDLVLGFPPVVRAGARWRRLATAKLAEMDELIARAETMKDLLRRIAGCRCGTLEQCGSRLVRAGLGGPPSRATRPGERRA